MMATSAIESPELFATHGRGIGSLVQRELLTFPGIHITRVVQGKIFFRVLHATPPSGADDAAVVAAAVVTAVPTLPPTAQRDDNKAVPTSASRSLVFPPGFCQWLRSLGSVERVFLVADTTFVAGEHKESEKTRQPSGAIASTLPVPFRLPQALSSDKIAQGSDALAQRLVELGQTHWRKVVLAWEELHQRTQHQLGGDEKQQPVKEYRAACKVRGRHAHGYQAQALAETLTAALSQHFAVLGYIPGEVYNVSGMELYTHINDTGIVTSLPLFRSRGCLSKRSYSRGQPQGGALRACVAWCMAILADLHPSITDTSSSSSSSSSTSVSATRFIRTCDLMAGRGITLIEAARMNPYVACIGGDCSAAQLQEFADNVQACEPHVRARVAPVEWLLGHIPLADGSVDVILCDLPFGHKFGAQASLTRVYSAFVMDMDRVLAVGGCAVLLTSAANAPMLERILNSRVADPPPPPPPPHLPSHIAAAATAPRPPPAAAAAPAPAAAVPLSASSTSPAVGSTRCYCWEVTERVDVVLGSLRAIMLKVRHTYTNHIQRRQEVERAHKRAAILQPDKTHAPHTLAVPLATSKTSERPLSAAPHSAHNTSSDSSSAMIAEAVGSKRTRTPEIAPVLTPNTQPLLLLPRGLLLKRSKQEGPTQS